MLKKRNMEVYPVTIVCDRYAGTYSGGQFLAFNLYPDDIPDAIGGEDMDEAVFWADGAEHCKYIIGIGSDPNEAFADLGAKMSEIQDA